MSKGILVVDMPESCSKCKFLYEFQGMKKCNLMNVLNSGNSRLSQNNFTKCRHDNCPLVELPEKMPEPEGFEPVETSVKRVGWNALWDKIVRQ